MLKKILYYFLGKDVQRKWKSLKDCYYKNIRNQESKAGDSSRPRKSYIYHKQLSFLQPFYAERQWVPEKCIIWVTIKPRLQRSCRNLSSTNLCRQSRVNSVFTEEKYKWEWNRKYFKIQRGKPERDSCSLSATRKWSIYTITAYKY